MKRGKSEPQFTIERLRLFRDVALEIRCMPKRTVAKVLKEKGLKKNAYAREVGALEDILGVYFLQRVLRDPTQERDGEKRLDHPMQARALQLALQTQLAEKLTAQAASQLDDFRTEAKKTVKRKFGRAELSADEEAIISKKAQKHGQIQIRSKSDLTPVGEAWADFAEIVVSLYDITLAITRASTQVNDLKPFGSHQGGVISRKGKVAYPNATDIDRYRQWLTRYRDEIRMANELLSAGDSGPEHLVQLLHARDADYDDNGNLREWARPA